MITLQAGEKEHIHRLKTRMQWALTENLLPFWANNAWDAQYGGFLTRLDRRGKRLDDSEKILMMQVRMIHALSAAHRYGLRDRGYLELAGKGFDYLIATFWDQENDGFYYSVVRDGQPLCKRKNTDFHAYAITSLAEYYEASGRAEALYWANRLFDVLMTQAADRDLGFIEDFDGGDWPALNTDQMKLGNQHVLKTIDMHANVLEGFVFLAQASALDRHKQAVRALLDLICARGIHREHGCTITAFDAEWRPVGDAGGRMTTSYGLNVELAWFIWKAAALLEDAGDIYYYTALGLIDHALAYGFDHKRGGLAAYGPITGAVLNARELGEDRLYKSWWAQAELLNALSDACRYTEDRRYFEALAKTFDWIYRFQIDHECGDWYQDTQWDTGRPLNTDKGREFKTAFHAGRALIRTLNILNIFD